MTENEAMALMRCRIDTASEIVGKGTDCKVFEDMEMAISALKEIQQYREIGTVEECREAVEKQKPKPCEFYGDEEDGKLLCPNCGEDLWDLKECGFNNCPYCGQTIQGEESEEEAEELEEAR